MPRRTISLFTENNRSAETNQPLLFDRFLSAERQSSV